MKFAVIDTWPGVKNAEYAFIQKLKYVCQKQEHELVIVNNEGFLVENDKVTRSKANFVEISFVLSLHFESPKLFDCYTYHTMWNPPEYPLRSSVYHKLRANILSVDDYVGYNSKGILSYINNLISNTCKTTNGYIEFVPSAPQDFCLLPSLGKKKIFYCGINWEKCSKKHGRHHGIFKALDKHGVMQIYGPKKFMGVRPWEGYRSYVGEIPFDSGQAMIKTINECGVSLVLSSDEHRRAGAVTNRFFDSLSAGVCIIADGNEFIKEEFGDSILHIDYDPEDDEYNYKQILNHYNWIISNPEQALKMAKDAQDIYKHRFSLDQQVKNIVESHGERKDYVYKSFHCKKSNKADIIYIYDSSCFDKEEFARAIDSFNSQILDNITVHIVLDQRIEEEVKKFLDSQHLKIKVKIFPIKMFNMSGNNLIVPVGKIINLIKKNIKSDYVAFCDSSTVYFKDHLTKNIQLLESKESSQLVYSGEAVEDSKQHVDLSLLGFSNHVYDAFELSDLRLGSCVVKRKFLDELPDFLTDNLNELFVPSIIKQARLNDSLVVSYCLTNIYNKDVKKNLFFGFPYSGQVKLVSDYFSKIPGYNHLGFSLDNENVRSSKHERLKEYLKEKLVRHPVFFNVARRIYNKFIRIKE